MPTPGLGEPDDVDRSLHRRYARQRVAEPPGHTFLRPAWLCRDCGEPWPCDPAQERLLEDYRGDRTGLLLYLGSCWEWAESDGVAYFTADTYGRFISWARAAKRSKRDGEQG